MNTVGGSPLNSSGFDLVRERKGSLTMMQRFQPGSFVWTFDQYGIGQVSSVEQDLCRVKFFKSVGDEFEAVYAAKELLTSE